VVPATDDSYRHWITVDCRFMPAGIRPSSGCLSVYTSEDDFSAGIVLHSRTAKLAATKGATKLFADEAQSLPPIDAVFRFGSGAVHKWLQSNKWEPEWGYNGNFKDPKPAGEYERAYQAQCPLYTGGAHAVLGGWHFPWPDGDWEELLDSKLLVWTFEESEPWVEVWREDGVLRVKQRIT